MVAFKSVLVGLAVVVPFVAGSGSGAAQAMEQPGLAVTRAAALERGTAVSNRQRPGQFPGLRGEALPVAESAALLRESEVVVRERCMHRPLFDQQLAFDCEPVVLPANVGGGPDADRIPELGGAELERLDPELQLENLPLNSAADSPDPLGLGVQLRL